MRRLQRGLDCEVNVAPQPPPMLDINGRSIGGMLPLFSAPDMDTVERIIEDGIADRTFGYNGRGEVILMEMVYRQDVDRFVEIGRELQAKVDAST